MHAVTLYAKQLTRLSGKLCREVLFQLNEVVCCSQKPAYGSLRTGGR